jgi:class 3 adenylate cyclase
MAQLVDDWEMFTETVGTQAFGFGFEGSKRYAEFIRECITQEVLARMIEAEKQIDLSSLLSEIQAPTLVVRHSGLKLPMDVTRRLAAGIPNARLYEVEGFYQDNSAQLGTTILEFLGVEVGSAAEEPRLDAGAFRTILFTDVEGSTPLTQRLGDAKAQDVLRTHNSIVRDSLAAHSGTEIKHTGDGIMASFPVASGALACAVAIQRALAEENANAETAVRVRIGLSAGEPVAEEGDLFGSTVQLAARVCAKADAGQIMVSNVVRELAMGKGFLFADLGDFVPKGFEDPVHVYEVSWS